VIKHGPSYHRFSGNTAAAPQGTNTNVIHILMPTCLLQLPAAAELSSIELVQLLSVAALCDNLLGMKCFCGLDLAEQLSSEMLMKPLRLAVERGSVFCVAWLCDLPAAAQLSSSDVEGLLLIAVEQEDIGAIVLLCQLPGAQEPANAQEEQPEDPAGAVQHPNALHRKWLCKVLEGSGNACAEQLESLVKSAAGLQKGFAGILQQFD
jgi:hypothetical protein